MSLEDKKKEHLATGGISCIDCKSENIDGAGVVVSSGLCTQELLCNECGKEFKNIYNLTKVEVY